MFYERAIIGIIFHLVLVLGDQAETIIDLYNDINAYGSLMRATSFDIQTQSKLKFVNTIRMISYQVPHNSTLFGFQIKHNSFEQVALIELRCNMSDVYIQLDPKSYHQVHRLPIISKSTGTFLHSFDLTEFLNNYHRRMIFLILNKSIELSSFSIVYYSKSNKDLFSISPAKHFQRRFRRTILPKDPTSTCAKHEYEVDFNQFSFGRWILQPKRFNAYVCSGSCPNPLSPQYYPSNHAILLSLMHSQKDYGQQPSCVPVRLKPLCLLYYDRDELVIKYHRDMIVQECGCR